MDLPTYTSIWRIEKRLYKLYDFRLPMPLPIGQVTVFAAVAVPYVLILQLVGLPFNHTLIWLYILPPGFVTWLVTRPVLESKRLPELVRSQLRYLAEPRVICRMAPLAERDVLVVTARVWRPRTARAVASAHADVLVDEEFGVDGLVVEGTVVESAVVESAAVDGSVVEGTVVESAVVDEPVVEAAAGQVSLEPAPEVAAAPPSRRPPLAPGRSRGRDRAAEPEVAAASAPGENATRVRVRARETVAEQPRAERTSAEAGRADATSAEETTAAPAPRPAWPLTGWKSATTAVTTTAAANAEGAETGDGTPVSSPDSRIEPGFHTSAAPGRPSVTVVKAGSAPSVERALAGPSARRGDARNGRVAVVPGGHRPGKPDLLHRDRARAQRPIGGPARVVVLGCTVGAGQTMAALLTGDVLASLRTDRVAVLDLNPGQGSLARRAEARPALGQAALLSPSRLAIITPPRAGANGPLGGMQNGPRADAELAFAAATDRYDLVIADPATVAVPRLLELADQLVLVAPASGAAAGAVAMTFEWLEAHGHAGLSARAIMVLNGVSRRSTAHVEQAERVCAGRCRAIVRVPWDDQLEQRPAPRMPATGPGQQGKQHWAGVLGATTAGAFTALAGVLVSSLADRADRSDRAGVTELVGRVPAQAGADPGHEPAEAGRGRR